MDYRTLDGIADVDFGAQVDEHAMFNLRGPQSERSGSVETFDPITTEADLRQFIIQKFGVKLSAHRCDCGVCTASPWEAFCYAYFAVGPVCLWTASRGFGGKSYNLALLANCEALTLRADVSVLAGSGLQSSKVTEAMGKQWAYPGAPRWALDGDPLTTICRFKWGNEVRAFTASQKTARGGHPQRLRLDEIDEMKLAILRAAQGQPMTLRGVRAQTVMSSTWQYPNGTFKAQLEEAAVKGWPVFRWCYRANLIEHGGYITPEDVAWKRQEVTALMWNTEYEMAEPSVEGRAIDPDLLNAAFVEELLEREAPAPAGRYATGADWGKERHRSIVLTLRRDTPKLRGVALDGMAKQAWPIMLKVFDNRVAEYHGAAIHDSTGVGNVLADFTSAHHAEGFVMVGRARQELFTEYIKALEDGDLEYPKRSSGEWEKFRLAHLYLVEEDLRTGGHPPDEFVAGALAHRAATSSTSAGGSKQPTTTTPNIDRLRDPGGGMFGRRNPWKPLPPRRRLQARRDAVIVDGWLVPEEES